MPQEIGGTHYQQGITTSPQDLIDTMQTSGHAGVDFLRGCIIKYAWRKKGDDAKMLEDLKKAQHCIAQAIERMEKVLTSNK